MDVLNAGEGWVSGASLGEVTGDITPTVKRSGATTEDGYVWFSALSFSTEKGEVALLLQWSQDFEKTDGSQSDRAPALYTQGDVSNAQAEAVLVDFTRRVERQIQLATLIAGHREVLRDRDGGRAAKAAYKLIKAFATDKELVRFFEDLLQY